MAKDSPEDDIAYTVRLLEMICKVCIIQNMAGLTKHEQIYKVNYDKSSKPQGELLLTRAKQRRDGVIQAPQKRLAVYRCPGWWVVRWLGGYLWDELDTVQRTCCGFGWLETLSPCIL